MIQRLSCFLSFCLFACTATAEVPGIHLADKSLGVEFLDSDEKEFFIRKAIGWVLRDTSRRRPELVITFAAPRVHRMSGVTVREVVRQLEPEIAEQLMAGYKARSSVDL